MKIILSFKEVKELKNIMETIEKDSCEAIVESFKNNKVLTCNVDMIKQQITVNIKEEYMIDFLAVYGKYAQVFVSQAKFIKNTIEAFGAETAKVIEKYTKEEKEVE